jgi:hypothetical protein
MTRSIYDQFAKDYLEELLSPLGEVQSPHRVASEVRITLASKMLALQRLHDFRTANLDAKQLMNCRSCGYSPQQHLKENWPSGVYFMEEYLRTGIIALHQLPRTPETLWLRIIGRGNSQKQAIDELENLPRDSQLRATALELFYQLQEHLSFDRNLQVEDRELVMRLRPLFQEKAEVKTWLKKL